MTHNKRCNKTTDESRVLLLSSDDEMRQILWNTAAVPVSCINTYIWDNVHNKLSLGFMLTLKRCFVYGNCGVVLSRRTELVGNLQIRIDSELHAACAHICVIMSPILFIVARLLMM